MPAPFPDGFDSRIWGRSGRDRRGRPSVQMSMRVGVRLAMLGLGGLLMAVLPSWTTLPSAWTDVCAQTSGGTGRPTRERDPTQPPTAQDLPWPEGGGVAGGAIIDRSFADEELERVLRGEDPLRPTPSSPAARPARRLGAAPDAKGDDWPEWRGRGRRGVWDEGGILEQFPATGLEVEWRAPIGSGFAGPAVADGRVFVLDFVPDAGDPTRGRERLHCLDQESGQELWTQDWAVDYGGLMRSYATGPRATPTVEVGRVFVVGATGILRCMATISGALVWQRDYAADFGTRIPIWGIAGAPLIDGGRLIAIVGGADGALVMAFDKRTGQELWRSLPAPVGPGYGQPVLIEVGGARQLVVWHPTGLASLDPTSGAVLWQEPWEVPNAMTVATPVMSDSYLLVSQFYGGSLMMRLDLGRPTATRLWQVGGTSERPEDTRGLHALISTPVIQGDYFYGVGSYGQLRGLDARAGERLWESQELVSYGRWAAAFFVRNGGRYFINTDQGELIIARLDPDGYHEIDRTSLIEPTTNSAWGRAGAEPRPRDRIVNWSHPAYAHRHVYARNDREILAASLEAEPEPD